MRTTAMHDIFQPYLLEDEKLEWTGQPRQGFLFTFIDIIAIPFSLAWFGLACTWESLALFAGENEGGMRWLFVLFGIPFVFVGYQMLIGRFFTDRKRRANTYYGITNKRALVLEGVKKKRLQEYFPKDLDDLRLQRSRKKYPSVAFGYWKTRAQKRSIISHWPYGVFSGFRMTEQAAEAFHLLEKLRDMKTEEKTNKASND
ncbi:MAG: hypothetical protein FD123_3762 [Bacteroidetes bacterium]|nr:MAG: hypothetical protein FD123_3762 [Bacteroidota bacterium]